MLTFDGLSFAIAWVVAGWLRFPREQFVALACTTTARKSPLALSLAVVFFPAQPVIALSQLIEPVLEIPSLIIFAALLRRRTQSAAALDASAPHAPLHPCISGTHRIEGAGERSPTCPHSLKASIRTYGFHCFGRPALLSLGVVNVRLMRFVEGNLTDSCSMVYFVVWRIIGDRGA
jgi:hypothetical protein